LVFFSVNPINELCLWHVKYLGHGGAGNVMTGIGAISSCYIHKFSYLSCTSAEYIKIIAKVLTFKYTDYIGVE